MNYQSIVESIVRIDRDAQLASGQKLNQILIMHNWLIGAYIFEYEQQGEDRISYGSHVVEKLAEDLKQTGMQGFSFSNLKSFRQFAMTYAAIANSATLPNPLFFQSKRD